MKIYIKPSKEVPEYIFLDDSVMDNRGKLIRSLHDVLIQQSTNNYQYYEVLVNKREIDFIVYVELDFDLDIHTIKTMMIDLGFFLFNIL